MLFLQIGQKDRVIQMLKDENQEIREDAFQLKIKKSWEIRMLKKELRDVKSKLDKAIEFLEQYKKTQ